MKNTKLPWYIKLLIVIGSLFWVLIIIGIIATPTDKDTPKQEKTGNKIANSETVKPDTVRVITLTENDYIQYFQTEWDSIRLYKDQGFPQYSDYTDSLQKVVLEINTIVQSNPDSFKRLKKLRLRFISSNKMIKANKNWLIYGQPKLEYDLYEPCEEYLRENANDPGSIDIDQEMVKGQSNNGWIVAIRYRGKNAFGGLVVNANTFEVKFNPSSQAYSLSNIN
jgi:hypothetical protein